MEGLTWKVSPVDWIGQQPLPEMCQWWVPEQLVSNVKSFTHLAFFWLWTANLTKQNAGQRPQRTRKWHSCHRLLSHSSPQHHGSPTMSTQHRYQNAQSRRNGYHQRTYHQRTIQSGFSDYSFVNRPPSQYLGIATLIPLTEADHKTQREPYFWLS